MVEIPASSASSNAAGTPAAVPASTEPAPKPENPKGWSDEAPEDREARAKAQRGRIAMLEVKLQAKQILIYKWYMHNMIPSGLLKA